MPRQKGSSCRPVWIRLIGLVFDAEMIAAGFFLHQSIPTHELAQFQIIGQMVGGRSSSGRRESVFLNIYSFITESWREIMEHNGEILLYQNTEGKIKLDVQLQDETVWLTQTQMSQLFGKAVSTINEHIKNIYSENELSPANTLRKFGISEFAKKPTNFYYLDVIISVGYRVKSQQGTQFCSRTTGFDTAG